MWRRGIGEFGDGEYSTESEECEGEHEEGEFCVRKGNFRVGRRERVWAKVGGNTWGRGEFVRGSRGGGGGRNPKN